MKFIKGKKELPWAVQKKDGFKGEAPGLYFHYFKTHAEAKACERWMKRHGKWVGGVSFREGECYDLGAFVL